MQACSCIWPGSSESSRTPSTVWAVEAPVALALAAYTRPPIGGRPLVSELPCPPCRDRRLPSDHGQVCVFPRKLPCAPREATGTPLTSELPATRGLSCSRGGPPT